MILFFLLVIDVSEYCSVLICIILSQCAVFFLSLEFFEWFYYPFRATKVPLINPIVGTWGEQFFFSVFENT